MVAFIGSWFIAWLLGGGLILAVILYFVFFKKNSLASMVSHSLQAFSNTISRKAFYGKLGVSNA